MKYIYSPLIFFSVLFSCESNETESESFDKIKSEKVFFISVYHERLIIDF